MVVVAQLVRAPGCGPGGRRFKSGLPPHFFAQILGKKITKTQVFTSLREAQLHSKPKVFFTSSLKHRSDLLVKPLHFIPLVKAFHSAAAPLYLLATA